MPKYLFVTGQLAAEALKDTLAEMAPEFEYDVAVLPITVAALMKPSFIAKHLAPLSPLEGGLRGGYDFVMIPGWCRGDLSPIEEATGSSVMSGPKDLKDIPLFFGRERQREGYGEYTTRILAEIVDAPLLSLEEILARAEYYRANGADVIDLGWPAEGDFPHVEEVVAALKERGFAVSLDTFHRQDVLRANRVGFDYLLSVNSSNLDLARQLSCTVVVVPDFGPTGAGTPRGSNDGLGSLERNIATLEEWGVSYIIDPILNPIHFGFTESLCRFYEVRQRHPDAPMLMGLGNLTELTDADSIGINALLMGVVSELNIDYVLTTEVISWARGSVRELDIARRLMHYSRQRQILPKEIDDLLIALKDVPHQYYSEGELRRIQEGIRDRNFRLFTDEEKIYVFNRDLFVAGTDPDEIFSQLGVEEASHAFYLGRELERAALAVRLGKKYIQEEPLHWGYLGGGDGESHRR
ncbi:MAG: PTS mannitol transporter subunit IIABC [Chloroflexi bacterium]|nr:PTS mannitol transporter subunit IIABC [Chloroflexota bacterium]